MDMVSKVSTTILVMALTCIGSVTGSARLRRDGYGYDWRLWLHLKEKETKRKEKKKPQREKSARHPALISRPQGCLVNIRTDQQLAENVPGIVGYNCQQISEHSRKLAPKLALRARQL